MESVPALIDNLAFPIASRGRSRASALKDAMLSHSSWPFLEALTTATVPSRLNATATERIRPEPGLAPSGSAQCRPLLPRPACKPARDRPAHRHAHRDLQPTEHRIVLSRPGGPGTRIGYPVSAARPPQVPPAHRSHARGTRCPMHTTRDRAPEVHHASSDIGDAKNGGTHGHGIFISNCQCQQTGTRTAGTWRNIAPVSRRRRGCYWPAWTARKRREHASGRLFRSGRIPITIHRSS